MSKYFIMFLGAQTLAAVLVWFQVNGQFMWKSFANNVLLLSLIGIPISYVFLHATRWGYIAFDEKVWPMRLIGFAIGTVLFAMLTWWLLGEVPDMKTVICIGLSIVIITIQLFL